MKTYVVMLAGGRGSRMNASVNKILMPLCGTPVIIRSLQAFSPYADETVIVARPDEQKLIQDEITRFDLSLPFRFAAGGETRQQSVLTCQSGSDRTDYPVHRRVRHRYARRSGNKHLQAL